MRFAEIKSYLRSSTLGALLATGSKTRAQTSPLPPGSLPGYGLEREIDLYYTKVTLLMGFEFGK